jgi:hypothetical protein
VGNLKINKGRSRVRALTVCEVIYMNREEFFKVFPKNEIARLKNMTKEIDLNLIVEKINA